MQAARTRSSVDRQSPGSHSESYESIMPLAQTKGSPPRPTQKRVASKAKMPEDLAEPHISASGFGNLISGATSQRSVGKQHLCDSCQEAGASVFCLNCQGWLCSRCEANIHHNKLFVRHERVSALDYMPPVMCKYHEAEVTTHICATCQELCCIYCIVSDSHPPGPDHIVQSVAKGLSVVRLEMSSALDLLQQKSSDLEQALESLKVSTDELNESVELVRSRTREGFERLRKILNEREADLLDNIERFKIEQSRDLHDKTQIIRAAHTGIRSLIQETTQKLQQSTGLGAVLEQVDGVDGSTSMQSLPAKHGTNSGTSEYKLALYKATNIIKFFTMRRDELLRGKEYDTRSATATAEILATEVMTPRRYFLDSEAVKEYIEGIKALEIALSEFGFKHDDRE